MQLLILLPFLIPVFTAAGCLILWRHLRWQRGLSLLGVFAYLVATLALLAQVDRHGILVMQVGNWPAPFGISLVADHLSAMMTAVTGIVAACVMVYSLASVDASRQQFGFHPLIQALLLGVTGAFLTGDLFDMYVWFEVMLIASFVLMCLGNERPQLEGAIKYVTLNLISSAWFLSAAAVLYGTTGTLNMADLSVQLNAPGATGVGTISASMLLIAFGIKAAVFPLFFWLPASYHTPPVAISAIMAGLLTKVGVYALIRVCSLLFVYEMPNVRILLAWIAGLTMVTGVLGAAAQSEIRRILSFHIVSQIGYMIMGLALFTPWGLTGMVFYILHHIIVKTNLFLIAGILFHCKGSFELTHLGGTYRERPWLSLLFLIPALSLAGIPPLSGFWAKLLLVREGLETARYILTGTALAVSLLTLYSMTKIWNEAFWKDVPEKTSQAPACERWQLVTMSLPCCVLAGMTLAIGFYAEPLLRLSQQASLELLDPSIYVRAVLGEK